MIHESSIFDDNIDPIARHPDAKSQSRVTLILPVRRTSSSLRYLGRKPALSLLVVEQRDEPKLKRRWFCAVLLLTLAETIRGSNH